MRSPARCALWGDERPDFIHRFLADPNAPNLFPGRGERGNLLVRVSLLGRHVFHLSELWVLACLAILPRGLLYSARSVRGNREDFPHQLSS